MRQIDFQDLTKPLFSVVRKTRDAITAVYRHGATEVHHKVGANLSFTEPNPAAHLVWITRWPICCGCAKSFLKKIRRRWCIVKL